MCAATVVNTQLTSNKVAPLNSGDHLSRAEFERRYQLHPEIKKAELIEGVVYMPSPVAFTQHGEPHAWLVGWLALYAAATPGTSIGDNATVVLDNENEVQPDILLRLVNGQSELDENGYIEGAPELIVEISASSAAYDRHIKQRVYARSGVREYIVVQMYERLIEWFALGDDGNKLLPADQQGIVRSRLFAGLWLDTAAFWQGDLAQMLATVQAGIKTAEHARFVDQLANG